MVSASSGGIVAHVRYLAQCALKFHSCHLESLGRSPKHAQATDASGLQLEASRAASMTAAVRRRRTVGRRLQSAVGCVPVRREGVGMSATRRIAGCFEQRKQSLPGG